MSVADAALDAAGAAFGDFVFEIHLVGRAGHGVDALFEGFHLRQAAQALFRAGDIGAGIEAGFLLAQFTTQDAVIGLGVAGEADLPHIGFDAGGNEDVKAHFAAQFVGTRHNVHLRLGVAFVGKAGAQGVGGFAHFAAVVAVARFEGDERFQLGTRHDEVALQLIALDTVHLALVHVDGEVNPFAVRRERDLRRGDGKIHEAPVTVEGFEAVNIRLQFVAVILVRLGQPGIPAWG